GGVGYLGSFSIDPIFTSSPGQGTVVWHFTVDNSALQSLAGDEDVTQYYNVAIDDQHGGIATQLISVTLNGVDDAPVASNDTGSANEAGGTNNDTSGTVASGNVINNDSDIDDAHNTLFVSAVRLGAENGAGGAGTVGQELHGAHGFLTLDANGGYTYAVDNNDPDVQALNTGDTLTDTFTYTVSDPGGLTDTAELTVTINGANDNPTISFV